MACGEGEDPVSPPPPDVPRAASIAVVSGDEQRAVAGTTLPEPVVVRVAAASGAPLGGATVTFTTAEGNGTADPAEAVTDAAGLARTVWTLGDADEQTLTAAVADGPSVQVTAGLLTPDDFVRAIAVVSGDGQLGGAGAALPEPVVVRAVDEAGVPVAGATVTFRPDAGHGTADPPEALTDTAGLARTVWTLGESVGTQTLTAVINDVFARVSATANTPDRAALEAFYHATGGPDWDNNENWLTDASASDSGTAWIRTMAVASRWWICIRTTLQEASPPRSANSHGLEPWASKTTGSRPFLPKSAASRASKTLDLTGNALTSVPPEVFDLPELDLLGLARNRLTRIPPELGNAPKLRNANLRLNELAGDIPARNWGTCRRWAGSIFRQTV